MTRTATAGVSRAASILTLALFAAACTPHHVVSPEYGPMPSRRADLRGVEVSLHGFDVRGQSTTDDSSGDARLRADFLGRLGERVDARVVDRLASSITDGPRLAVDVNVAADRVTQRTWILDFFFADPGLGFCPIPTPEWGNVTVSATAEIRGAEGAVVRSFSSTARRAYAMTWYSWYRTAPIERAFAAAYGEAFDGLADRLASDEPALRIAAGLANPDDLRAVHGIAAPAVVAIASPAAAASAPTGSAQGPAHWQAPTLVRGPSYPKRYATAVLDVQPDGPANPDVAHVLGDFLRERLLDTGSFIVIDRAHMDAVLKEQKFQLSECVSSECVVQVGQLVGAERIVSARLSRLGRVWNVSATLVNVETGEIQRAASERCECQEDELFPVVEVVAKRLGGWDVAANQ